MIKSGFCLVLTKDEQIVPARSVHRLVDGWLTFSGVHGMSLPVRRRPSIDCWLQWHGLGGANMVAESTMLATVGAIYDAGLDPALWPAALERMAEMLGTTSAAIGFLDAGSRVTFRVHARADERAVSEYADRYRFIDPVFKAVSSRPPGKAFSDEMFVPKSELWQSRLYSEWCRPHDLVHAVQAFASRDAEHSALITFSRSQREEAFNLSEVDVVTTLLPHITRALHVQMRLQAAQVAQESTAAALDRVPQAVMLVDAQTKILHANQAAVGLLLGAGGLDGGPLGLSASRPDQTRTLHRLVMRASTPGPDRIGGTMLLDVPGLRSKFVVHVVPHGKAEVSWTGAVRPTAIVVVVAPGHGNVGNAEHALKTLFGLTTAEATTACMIAKGTGVQTAAADLGVEPSTVRTHLVRAYAKTGMRRQAELADLVGQLAGVINADLKL